MGVQMNELKDKMCPLMSCRTTSVSDPALPNPSLTPTIARCMKGDCALWEPQNKACVFVSILIEQIKAGGE